MEIRQPAIAGTLESSDAQITVEPLPDQLDVTIESSVMNQYGRQVQSAVMETLSRLDVTSGRIAVVDKGALDCTLRARVECAVLRSASAADDNVDWGGVIR